VGNREREVRDAMKGNKAVWENALARPKGRRPQPEKKGPLRGGEKTRLVVFWAGLRPPRSKSEKKLSLGFVNEQGEGAKGGKRVRVPMPQKIGDKRSLGYGDQGSTNRPNSVDPTKDKEMDQRAKYCLLGRASPDPEQAEASFQETC